MGPFESLAAESGAANDYDEVRSVYQMGRGNRRPEPRPAGAHAGSDRRI